MNEVHQRVTIVNGWVLMTKSWNDRPGVEWHLTPVESTDGPLLKFRTPESATEYASMHDPDGRVRHPQ